MSEFWLCFNCCIAEQPQPKRRRRIDRSMIGEPTNFVHTAHVGSGDLFSGMNSDYCICRVSKFDARQGRAQTLCVVMYRQKALLSWKEEKWCFFVLLDEIASKEGALGVPPGQHEN
ncbi:PREDICTED: CDC42 small effector protein 2 [Tinamus guttatus]|uniref:CDC42 small effector protein 2 n=1 Tax=Tinamus guttatus TaxID=94827 RepID=UPI00052EB49E|nr:PREDICTED: CDC42 small effector protein 2 [Tinamus guttatus]